MEKVIREILGSLEGFGNCNVQIMSWHEGCEWANGASEYPLLNKLRKLYKEVVLRVQEKWGEPVYEGDGLAVVGHQDANGVIAPHVYKGPNWQTLFASFDKALELACWDHNEKVAVVMVTTHDGGSLISLNFALAIKNRSSQSRQISSNL